MYNAWGFNNTTRTFNIGGWVTYQPVNTVRISLNPSYGYGYRKQDQFVDQVDYNGTVRTIVSQVKQRDFSLTARITCNITPELTIQYYGQPFIFRALYDHYGIVKDPMNADYNARFETFNNDRIQQQDDRFLVDENGDGTTDYTFGQPDFNFIQFRSNLVVRWEYTPGSELFLVWSQGSTPNAYNDLDSPLPRSLFSNVFDEQARNVFLLKCTYRLVR